MNENENENFDEVMDYVGEVAEIYDEIIKMRDNHDYVINQRQMEKFVEIVEFFRDLMEDGDEIESVRLEPKMERGDVTVRFVVFTIRAKQVQRFSEILKFCSVFSLHATLNGRVCISCTVPDVFVRKGIRGVIAGKK